MCRLIQVQLLCSLKKIPVTCSSRSCSGYSSRGGPILHNHQYHERLPSVSFSKGEPRFDLTGFSYFDMITDHNPLISILNSHRMDEIENLRLQCLCMKVMDINFKAVWHKGIITNQAPDAMVRCALLSLGMN